MATLNKSTGVAFPNTLDVKTTRKIVQDGSATVITPGNSGFDVVQLINSTLDTQYTAATTNNPVLLGVDDILFLPLQFPEPVGGL